MSSLRFTLAFFLLLGGLVSPTLAQIDISLPTAVGTIGEDATLDITVGDLTGQNVIAYELVVQYDPDIVEITGATAVGTRSSSLNVVTNTATAGQITIAAAGSSPMTGSGTLIQLNATYLAQGTSALTFGNAILNEGSPAANTSDGSLQVQLASDAPTFELSHTDLDFGPVIQGETRTETFNVLNTGGGTISGSISLTGNGYALVSGGGAYTLAAGASHAVTVSFTPSALAEQAGTVSVTHDAANVASPGTVSLTGTGVESDQVIEVILPTVRNRPGTTSFIDVRVPDWKGQSFVALEFTLTFNSDVINVLDVVKDGTAIQSFAVIPRLDQPNEVRVASAGGNVNFVPNTDLLFRLEISNVAEGTTDLSFSRLRFNNGSPLANVTNGNVTVSNPAPIINVAPTETQNFGEIGVGSEASQTFTIQNTGDASLSGTLSVEGDGFAVDGSSLLSVNQGASEDITVTFAPVASGEVMGTLSIVHNDPFQPSPIEVALVGTGNSAPNAEDDTAVTDEDTAVALEVLSNDSDVENDPLSITTLGDPTNGTVALDEAVITYTPDENYNGTDSFTYTVGDGISESTATVTVTVTAINDAPTAAVITSPAPGASVAIMGDPALPFRAEWDASVDAEGDPLVYTWQLNNTDDFSTPLLEAETGDDTSFETTFGTLAALLTDNDIALSGDVTLFHRVVTTDGTVSTEGASASVTLAITNTAPTAAVITAPAPGATLTINGDPALPFRAEWDAATDAEDDALAYTWQLSDADDFAVPLLAAPTGADTFFETTFGTLAALLIDNGVALSGDVTLFHRVVSTDSTVSTAGASASVTLTITNTAPTAAVITAPAPGASLTITGDPGTLFRAEWEASVDAEDDALGYTWQLSTTDDFADPLLAVETGSDAFFETTFGVVGPLLTDNGVDLEGSIELFHRVITTDGTVTIEGASASVTLTRSTLTSTAEETLPTRYELDQNYPNPFNPVTAIRFGLPEATHVRLTVHDALGRQVRTLVDEVRPAGRHTVTFEGTDLPSGTYLYRISAGSYDATRTLTLLK